MKRVRRSDASPIFRSNGTGAYAAPFFAARDITALLLHLFCPKGLQSIMTRCILLFVDVFNNEGHLFL